MIFAVRSIGQGRSVMERYGTIVFCNGTEAGICGPETVVYRIGTIVER